MVPSFSFVGVMLLPACGLHSVPGECLARRAHEALSSADTLEVGVYGTRSAVSSGAFVTHRLLDKVFQSSMFSLSLSIACVEALQQLCANRSHPVNTY